LLFLLILGAVFDLLSVLVVGSGDDDDGKVAVELVLPNVVVVRLFLLNENRSETEEEV
jgi:hypothetical protein